MKISSFLGLMVSLFFLYFLENIIFWLHLSSFVIYYLVIIFIYILSDEDKASTCCKDAWENTNEYENFLFFSFPLIAIFKIQVLKDKDIARDYGIKLMIITLLSLIIYYYIFIEYIIILLFIIIHIVFMYILSYEDRNGYVYIENKLIVFIVYSLPVTYLLVWFYNSFIGLDIISKRKNKY